MISTDSGILLPLLVLRREAKASIRGVSRADTQQLLMLVNANSNANVTAEKDRQERNGERERDGDGDGESSKHTKGTYVYKSQSRYPSSDNTHIGGLAGKQGNSINLEQQSTVRVRNPRADTGSLSGGPRGALDYGIGFGTDEVEFQTNPTTALSSRQLSPREGFGFGSAEKRVIRDYSLKHPNSCVFRDNTLLSDHDAPLPGQADLYHELDEKGEDDKYGSRAEHKVRETRGRSSERGRDTKWDRDREVGSSYGGSIASTNEGRGKSRSSERSLTSVASLLRLQIASRPIDISRGRRASQTSSAGQPVGGVSNRGGSTSSEAHGHVGGHGWQNTNLQGGSTPGEGRGREGGSGSSGTGGSEERFSDSGEREREIEFQRPTSSARRFISGISSKMSSAVQNRSVSTSKTKATSGLSGSKGAEGAEEWATSVPPEALLTALKMSMEENSSSLAMVI